MLTRMAGTRPTRVDVLVRIRSVDGTTRVTARDAATGRYSEIDISAETTLFALAPDGGAVVVGVPEPGGSSLVVWTFATGSTEVLAAGPGSGDTAAAYAPDGKRVVALAEDDDRAVATVLDLASGSRRLLWSVEGVASADPRVTWSPDGAYIAVTYVTLDDDSFTTAILSADGTVVAELPGMEILGGAGRAWLGSHGLLMVDEFWDDDGPVPIVVFDAATGSRRQIPRTGYGPVLGAVDGRLVHLTDDGGISSTTFEEADPRPLLPTGPGQEILFFDALPGALGLS
jgi:dipeptidyl aminopeptidase/acylaminoacyl peptidase